MNTLLKIVFSTGLLLAFESQAEIKLSYLQESECLKDSFKRVVCRPPDSVLSAYEIKINKSFSNLDVRNRFTNKKVKLRFLVDVKEEAKIDVENIIWVISSTKESGEVLSGLIYKEDFIDSFGNLHEAFTVLDLDPLKSCAVSRLSSERLGPESKLLQSAKRIATNLSKFKCL